MQQLCLVALFVEFEQAGEDFVAEIVRPTVSPGLLLLTRAAGVGARVVCILFVVGIGRSQVARLGLLDRPNRRRVRQRHPSHRGVDGALKCLDQVRQEN